MNKEKFINALKNPSDLSGKELNELISIVKTYPYFQVARSVLAKGIKEKYPDKSKKYISSAALFAPDRTHFKKFLDGGLYFLDETVIEEIPKKPVPARKKVDNKKTEKTKIPFPEPEKSENLSESQLDNLISDIFRELEELKESKRKFTEIENRIEEEDAINKAVNKAATSEEIVEKKQIEEPEAKEIEIAEEDPEETKQSTEDPVSDEKETESKSKIKDYDEDDDVVVKKFLDDDTGFRRRGRLEPAEKDSKQKEEEKADAKKKAEEEAKKKEEEIAKQEAEKKAEEEAKKKEEEKAKKEEEIAKQEAEAKKKAEEEARKKEEEKAKKKEEEKAKEEAEAKKKEEEIAKKEAEAKKKAEEEAKKKKEEKAKKEAEAKKKAEEESKKKEEEKAKREAEAKKKAEEEARKKEEEEKKNINLPKSTGRVKKKEDEEIIADFIKKSPNITPAKPTRSQKPIEKKDLSAKSSRFHADVASEYLAEIYIEQGKYDRAISIYENLGLKFPEKKSYFAGLIEKLSKK